MTREDIIAMAREAGIDAESDTLCRQDGWVEPLERFAAAARNRTWTQDHWTEYERAIAAAEREACAKVCEETTAAWTQHVYNQACMDCAAAIRARGA